MGDAFAHGLHLIIRFIYRGRNTDGLNGQNPDAAILHLCFFRQGVVAGVFHLIRVSLGNKDCRFGKFFLLSARFFCCFRLNHGESIL